MAGLKVMVKGKAKSWTGTLCLAIIALTIWLLWAWIDPRLIAIHYVSSSPFRNFICGFNTFELLQSLYASLPVVGWIGIGFILISIVVTYINKQWSGFILVFGFTAIVYALGASLNIGEQSGAPHFVYLADAFNHGRLSLDQRPPEWQENDWTEYKGEWSVSFPPAPAILMMPFAAVYGKSFNDVIFTVILGAFNAALFFKLVPRVGRHLQNKFEINKAAQIVLTVAFAFGTVHWWLASFGQVWFTAQIVATTFILLALLETFGQQRPFWVGLWVTWAALARPPILLSLPAFVWLLVPKNSPRKLGLGLVPVIIAGIFIAAYNYLRYDNPFELGYQYMHLDRLLAARVESRGSFNLIYLIENLKNAFWKTPSFRKTCPFVVMDGWGLSMFFSTPLLLLIFTAPWRDKAVQAALMGAALVAIPSFLYYNTGYLQAGYRYSLDFLPLLFIPLIAASKGRLNWKMAGLVILSVYIGFLSLVNFYLLANGMI
jgi:hypothetical protein